MAKNIKLTHDQKIIKALEKIKTPIIDKLRNLSIYFKAEARSNESGIEHIAITIIENTIRITTSRWLLRSQNTTQELDIYLRYSLLQK